MKVWITKYALTNGIEEFDGAVLVPQVPGEILVRKKHMDAYYHQGNWHTTREAAVTRAEEMRLDKIASLRKQIGRLEKLKFE